MISRQTHAHTCVYPSHSVHTTARQHPPHHHLRCPPLQHSPCAYSPPSTVLQRPPASYRSQKKKARHLLMSLLMPCCCCPPLPPVKVPLFCCCPLPVSGPFGERQRGKGRVMRQSASWRGRDITTSIGYIGTRTCLRMPLPRRSVAPCTSLSFLLFPVLFRVVPTKICREAYSPPASRDVCVSVCVCVCLLPRGRPRAPAG